MCKSKSSGLFLVYLLWSCLKMIIIGAIDVRVNDYDEEIYQQFSLAAFVKSFGFPIEVHHDVRTEDNYLLTLHRIPQNSTSYAPIVLLMHGLGTSADSWVILGPEKSLPFLLHKRGYDVWMGNARGTFHSRRHVVWNPDRDAKYWDYDWHQIGYYDMPATVKYILKKTGQKELIVIGHSQGGTALFVALSERKEMNGLIKLGVGMSPAVFLGFEGMVIPSGTASVMFGTWEMLRNLLGIREVGPQVVDLFCNSPIFKQEICDAVMLGTLMSSGLLLDVPQLNFTGWSNLRRVVGVGISFKQVLHFGQTLFTGEFKHYDYGPLRNVEKYGSMKAPEYDLSQVTIPIALFRGNADTVIFAANVERLAKLLPNVVLEYLVPNPLFSHIDFVTANDVVPLLYNRLFSLLEQYRNK